jgi:CHRD domain-containing protein
MRLVWAGRMAAVVAVVLGLTVVTTTADEGTVSAKAKLSGFNETPVPKLTDGTGTFTATINGGKLTYKLTFSGLSSDALMSHIHFAQPGVTGGVYIWLCGTTGAFAGPAGTPTCPVKGGTVTGTATAANVLPIPTENLNAGDFAGALRILQSGDAYVNVHSVNFPGGEIRGQVKTSSGD